MRFQAIFACAASILAVAFAEEVAQQGQTKRVAAPFGNPDAIWNKRDVPCCDLGTCC